MKLDQSRLEYYITPEQAAKQLGLDLDSIFQLADEEKLQAAVMTDGSIGISQISVNNLLPKEALPEYQLNAGLKGVPISINEAGRKYKLNTSTLTRWMQRGLIHQLGKEGRKTLLASYMDNRRKNRFRRLHDHRTGTRASPRHYRQSVF